jgi:Uma2 family endonuclease
MATGIFVPVEEYLRTVYEPDADYCDGEVIARNVGEHPHAWLQGLLCAYLLRRRKKWGITPVPEQRIRIREGKYMIPDVCVLLGTGPWPKILTEPPLIWIEILSSEDRPIRVQRKIEDILEFGADYVWVIDPETLESYVATKNKRFELLDGVFRIDAMNLIIPLHELEED